MRLSGISGHGAASLISQWTALWSHHKHTLSQVGTHRDVTSYVAGMNNNSKQTIIALLHWCTRLLATWPNIPLSHIIPILSKPVLVLYPINARHCTMWRTCINLVSHQLELVGFQRRVLQEDRKPASAPTDSAITSVRRLGSELALWVPWFPAMFAKALGWHKNFTSSGPM